MPRHDEMYVPAFKTRIVPCPECGEPMECGWKTRLPRQCIACGERKLTDACRQISEKRGPAWDAWRRGVLNFLYRDSGGREERPANVPDSVSDT